MMIVSSRPNIAGAYLIPVQKDEHQQEANLQFSENSQNFVGLFV